MQVRRSRRQRSEHAQSCHARDDGPLEGVAARAPEEPVPHQGREDNAGHHHQNDADSGK